MDESWIVDVLSDMRQFADMNGMDALSEQLEAAEDTARFTIALGASKSGAVRARHGGDNVYVLS